MAKEKVLKAALERVIKEQQDIKFGDRVSNEVIALNQGVALDKIKYPTTKGIVPQMQAPPEPKQEEQDYIFSNPLKAFTGFYEQGKTGSLAASGFGAEFLNELTTDPIGFLERNQSSIIGFLQPNQPSIKIGGQEVTPHKLLSDFIVKNTIGEEKKKEFLESLKVQDRKKKKRRVK